MHIFKKERERILRISEVRWNKIRKGNSLSSGMGEF